MGHPHRDKVEETYAEKLARLTEGKAKAETPQARAFRIAGTADLAKMGPPPLESVAQFENDRGLNDPPYGSLPKDTADD